MSKDKLPFRTEPHGQASDDLIRRVRYVRSADQDTRIEWAEHPEEVVAATLAHTSWLQKERSRHADEIRTRLFIRGIDALREEGEVWNPIVDGIARGPHVLDYSIRRIAREKGISPTPYESPPEMAWPAADWIQEQNDPRRVEALLGFRSSDIQEQVAQHGPLDRQLALGVVGRNAAFVDRVAANPRLTREAAAGVYDWAFAKLFDHDARNLEEYGVAIDTLDRRKMRPVRRAEIDALLDACELDPTPRIDGKKAVDSHERVVVTLVLLGRHLTHADLERLLPRVLDSGALLTTLCHAPALDVAMARRALAASRLTDLRGVISERADLRRDPGVREVLERSENKEVTQNLLDDARDDEEFAVLFGRLLASPDHALQYLERRPDVMARVSSRDFLPLLQHPDPRIRLRAVSVMGAGRSAD